VINAINGAIVRAYLAAKRDEGQALVEYALIVVLIAIAAAATLFTLGRTSTAS
jgi:Flp pilus assembly pilin Flp